jgi:hypothetical protein
VSGERHDKGEIEVREIGFVDFFHDEYSLKDSKTPQKPSNSYSSIIPWISGFVKSAY